MTNKEIFEAVKDNFAGVKMIDANKIKLMTKDGQEFETEQNQFDKEYKILFFCHGDIEGGCNADCEAHGSEKWEISER